MFIVREAAPRLAHPGPMRPQLCQAQVTDQWPVVCKWQGVHVNGGAAQYKGAPRRGGPDERQSRGEIAGIFLKI